MTEEGDIVEVKAMAVECSGDFPEGVKYSMAFIHRGRRVLCFDNERGKGHHEHRFDRERPLEYRGIEDLLARFEKAVTEVRGELYGDAR